VSTGTDQPLSFVFPSRSLDKIYYRPDNGSTSVAQSATPVAPTFTTVPVPHGKGEIFMLDVQMSVDNSVWYELGSTPFYVSSSPAGYFPRFVGYWSMDSTNVYLSFAANDASYTVYYRMIGYPIA
jgi:hypothetical protein